MRKMTETDKLGKGSSREDGEEGEMGRRRRGNEIVLFFCSSLSAAAAMKERPLP